MSKKAGQPADISVIYRCGKGWPVFFNFGTMMREKGIAGLEFYLTSAVRRGLKAPPALVSNCTIFHSESLCSRSDTVNIASIHRGEHVY